jgi:hypothetical protein
MNDINRHVKTKLATMTTRWWWQNAFSFRPVYIWRFKYRCCESKRRVNTKTIETCSVTIQYTFFGEQSAMRLWESPSNIPRPFVSFDIFQLIFVRETRIRSSPAFEKVYTHNVYWAVTAANVGRWGGQKKWYIYLNQNNFTRAEWPWPRPSW